MSVRGSYFWTSQLKFGLIRITNKISNLFRLWNSDGFGQLGSAFYVWYVAKQISLFVMLFLLSCVEWFSTDFAYNCRFLVTEFPIKQVITLLREEYQVAYIIITWNFLLGLLYLYFRGYFHHKAGHHNLPVKNVIIFVNSLYFHVSFIN